MCECINGYWNLARYDVSCDARLSCIYCQRPLLRSVCGSVYQMCGKQQHFEWENFHSEFEHQMVAAVRGPCADAQSHAHLKSSLPPQLPDIPTLTSCKILCPSSHPTTSHMTRTNHTCPRWLSSVRCVSSFSQPTAVPPSLAICVKHAYVHSKDLADCALGHFM